MENLSVFDKMKLREEKRANRTKEVYDKNPIKFGVIKVSARLYGVIEYSGPSIHGDWEFSDNYWVKHNFKFVEGMEKVSYTEAEEVLKRLQGVKLV